MPAAKPLTDEEAILLLLETEPDFAGAYACTPTEPFASDAEYLIASELRFTLQSLYVQALGTLRCLVVGGSRRGIYADDPASACSPTETAARVSTLRSMRDAQAACMRSRLGVTPHAPRVVAVAEAYAMSEVEASVLELIVLQRCHRTVLFANCLQAVDAGYDSDHMVVPTLSGASSLQLAAFFEEERPHVKVRARRHSTHLLDPARRRPRPRSRHRTPAHPRRRPPLRVQEGVVVIDEDYSSRQTASISTEACDALVHGLRARPGLPT